jgi:hypothetical protein
MNKHDIINDPKWAHELAEIERKEKLEIRLFAAAMVLLFATFSSPVFFQFIFGLILKG